MPERTLIARVRDDAENPGALIVASPVVGLADLTLHTGVFLNRYDSVLTMVVLGRRHVLRLPRDVQGWVVQAFIGNALTPVGFDAPLLRLDPRIGAEARVAQSAGGGSGNPDDSAGDNLVVKAPTEGIFYRRSAPDTPPFVEVGGTVTNGTVLGLIEVMKCFNQIAYGGPGLPETGTVSRILVQDAAEVHFGQPLFWIRPPDPGI
jgi:biotin carboxyl carrier protein